MKAKILSYYPFIILLAVSLIRGVSGPSLNSSSGIFLPPVSQSLQVGIGTLSLSEIFCKDCGICRDFNANSTIHPS